MLFTRSLSVGLWALWRRGALGKEDLPRPPCTGNRNWSLTGVHPGWYLDWA